ncbi:NADPH-dependent FMN reductase [Pararhodonellum marinum]|uniref:NADPH-dependent FMN reductase n=1 Tax=Pararhodonellum marinum TaxID=2755358 RepID=UPI00188E97A6|nr:NAD(P)H-dependent oxidoreductase [Pararhodonellum marinum]
MTNITIISGSPRESSLTYRVALLLKKTFEQEADLNVTLVDVREWKLPLLQKVFTGLEKTPEEYRPLFEIMEDTHGFVLVSPEYNGSYSPALKNLLDHFPKSVYSGKTFGFSTASPGAMGGMRAAQQLYLLAGALFGIPSPMMLITPKLEEKIDEKGNLIDEAFNSNLDKFKKQYLSLVEKLGVVKEVKF